MTSKYRLSDEEIRKLGLVAYDDKGDVSDVDIETLEEYSRQTLKAIGGQSND